MFMKDFPERLQIAQMQTFIKDKTCKSTSDSA